MQTVPLSALKVSQINVRKTRAGAEPKYAASIRAKGIIEPLIVRQYSDTQYEITNGGKRFAALQFLRENNEYARGERVTDTYPVPINIRDENDAEARETSLTTNLVRSDMHPVDLHQAFVDLIADGKTEADIAAEYLMTDREVKQVLALGQLSPKVLEAWKEEKIDAELAQAFTVGQSHKIQEKALVVILQKIKEEEEDEYGGDVTADDVKEQFKLSSRDIGRLVEFVGVEECEKRGCKVERDLFGIDHTVSKEKIVEATAIEKLDAICFDLIEQGWSWAVREGTVNNRYNYSGLTLKEEGEPTEEEAARLAKLKRIFSDVSRNQRNFNEDRAADEFVALEDEIKARGYTAEQKAKGGCFVSVSETGVLEIEYGRVKPAQAKAAAAVDRAIAKPGKKAEKAADKKPNLQISANTMLSLSRQLTEAVRDALSANPDLGIPALLAGFASGDVVKIDDQAGKRQPFDAAFAEVRKSDFKRQKEQIAAIAGGFCHMVARVHGDGPLKHKGNLALCEALGAPLYAALKKHFDAKDYFSSVNAHVCRQKLKEMFGPAYQAKWDTEKKGALEKVAVTKTRETGWLPPELRTSFYAGPSAAPAAPKKAKPEKKARG